MTSERTVDDSSGESVLIVVRGKPTIGPAIPAVWLIASLPRWGISSHDAAFNCGPKFTVCSGMYGAA